MAGMLTSSEIRRRNLIYLVGRAGGVTRLAENLDISPAQLSQWVNANVDKATGRPRSISEDSCRAIEAKLGLETGWLDNVHDSMPPWPVKGITIQALSLAQEFEELAEESAGRPKSELLKAFVSQMAAWRAGQPLEPAPNAAASPAPPSNPRKLRGKVHGG